MKKLCILGSTGSLGRQAAESSNHLGFKVTAIAANTSVDVLEQQIRMLKPDICAVADENAAKALKIKVSDTNTKIISGEHSAEEAAAVADADTVLNCIIGIKGLLPTLAAIDSKKNIALANKETLVAAGDIVNREINKNNLSLIPVDSEHCAIHQCLRAGRKNEVSRLILTASGGPFFGMSREEIRNKTPEDALKHPNWSMGRKITIDSATLVNKGLELIEASRLFGVSEEKIDVVIQRESIIHSMVEFVDGSVIAQLSVPDMRLAIQYALTYPERVEGLTGKMDFTKLRSLTFATPDNSAFPSLELARRALRLGGIVPCVYNSANEELVELFLAGKIAFGDIPEGIEKAMLAVKNKQNVSVTDIIDADRESREYIKSEYLR